jgi:hypothetical protein
MGALKFIGRNLGLRKSSKAASKVADLAGKQTSTIKSAGTAANLSDEAADGAKGILGNMDGGRTPTPDYSPASSRRSSVENHIYEKTSAPPVKPKRSEAEKLLKQQYREARKIKQNQKKYPELYEHALNVSQPNTVYGRSAQGSPLKTTDQKIGYNSMFGTDEYKSVVTIPMKQKSMRWQE